ncbi:histone-lysine N-methyltransferase [Trypanosoma theileri]|uniref:Histone-lysine N-methyltransferase, H3 lysine-79 specific n=1 Tax=Trypanosoma theileri TaxID=67003 RepID=A0A1X0NY45_9TRYP|nr:histone-lysine N-methyltransferase [Trypanosoma theileri]ORC89090.1 histone-lysine N-methyltransferase [Trypanosoma theileri]
MLRHVRRNNQDRTSGLKRPRQLEECGFGTPAEPFRLPLRKTPNGSNCLHCVTDMCDCKWVEDQLRECYSNLSVTRQVQQYRKRELCAKSVLPPFVARLVRLSGVKSGDVFYDLGCGNGSVLFHVALLTGARCVGVEINERNATVAREAWRYLQPIFEARCGKSLDVEIITGDFCSVVKREEFFSSSPVVWVANLLLPRPVNHFLSERFRLLPEGSRILCMEDLYPHARSVAALRDPDAFEKFTMTDFKWQAMSVEWSYTEGSFYMYTRRESEKGVKNQKEEKKL